MPHLDDVAPLERAIDLAIAGEREKDLRQAERVIVALLAELHGASPRALNPTVRRQAYGWLFEQAAREEKEQR